MPEISSDEDLNDSEGAEAARAAHVASGGVDAGRQGSGASGSGDRGDGGRAMPGTSTAVSRSSAGSPSVLPQRARVDPPRYEPLMLLSTERYQLHGVSPADLAAECVEMLKDAVELHTARHLVGACVRPGHDSSGLEVTLEVVGLADGLGSGAVAGGAAGSTYNARRLIMGATERRKPAVPLQPDAELGADALQAALLRQPWWRPRTWALWARRATTCAVAALTEFKESLGVLRPSRSDARSQYLRARRAGGLCAGAGAGSAAAQRREGAAAAAAAPEGAVVASRITEVAPRVVLVGKAPAAGLEPQSPPGEAAACGRPLPAGSVAPALAPAPAPASGTCLQVSASVCCISGVASTAAQGPCGACSGSGKAAGQVCRPAEACRMASCAGGLSLEVLLRQGYGFASACALSGEAPKLGAAPGPSTPKTCRRPQCRQHLTLRQELFLTECRNETATAPSAAGNGLGPGLLLLDMRTDPGQRALAHRTSVPVVVVDDPWVAQELQVALARCGGATNFDELLIDLGIFLQRIAELRRAAAPVLAVADAGQLRPLRRPPCRCHLSSGGVGGNDFAPSGTTCPATPLQSAPGAGSDTSPGDGPGGTRAAAAAAAGAAAAAASVCVTCELRRLRASLKQFLSGATTQVLGEYLLRHATSAGWPRTASYISSCLVDLQRIDVLVEAVLGPRRWASPEDDDDDGDEHGDVDAGVWWRGGSRRRAAAALRASLRTLWRRGERFLQAFLAAAAPESHAEARVCLRRGFRERGFRGLLAQARRLRVAQYLAWLLVCVGVQLLSRVVLQGLARLAAWYGVALPAWLQGPSFAFAYALLAVHGVEAFLRRFSAGVWAVQRGSSTLAAATGAAGLGAAGLGSGRWKRHTSG